MSDQVLLLFGCSVTMLALGGVYVAIRERIREHDTSKPVVMSTPAAEPLG